MFGRIVLDIPADHLRRAARRGRSTSAARRPTPTCRPTSCGTLADEYKRIVKREDRQRLPDRSVPSSSSWRCAPSSTSWFGKRAHDYREFNKIPHDLGTAVNVVDDGVRQHGRRLGHRGRLHARPEYRRAGALRRVPDQRAGRGRGGRRSDAGEDQPDARRAAGGLPPVRGDRRAAGAPLPRRAGPRVHDRARHALHAPDPLREAHRAGRGEDRGRHGGRGRSSARRRRSSGSSPARSSSCSCRASTSRPRQTARTDCSARASTPRPAPPRSAARSSTRIGPSAAAGDGEPVILVRPETSPDDVHGMLAAKGVLTARGGATSHAAVVARGMGIAVRRGRREPADRLRGAHDAAVGGTVVNEGDMISHRRHDRRGLRRRDADDRAALRGRARPRHAARLG